MRNERERVDLPEVMGTSGLGADWGLSVVGRHPGRGWAGWQSGIR